MWVVLSCREAGRQVPAERIKAEVLRWLFGDVFMRLNGLRFKQNCLVLIICWILEFVLVYGFLILGKFCQIKNLKNV